MFRQSFQYNSSYSYALLLPESPWPITLFVFLKSLPSSFPHSPTGNSQTVPSLVWSENALLSTYEA
ncbi:hypothetical protein SLEP1_g43355 [Rubroshorea leprosula]|uniref:Uncharacterized protein n=1 Tax=Rubroshorea leprosula TaxID=152421 RepID=A0AAV5LCQ1_9ROSI|nr:hypothetical protein SLEP1_g43355 [Rubroshorea leprosula]